MLSFQSKHLGWNVYHSLAIEFSFFSKWYPKTTFYVIISRPVLEYFHLKFVPLKVILLLAKFLSFASRSRTLGWIKNIMKVKINYVGKNGWGNPFLIICTQKHYKIFVFSSSILLFIVPWVSYTFYYCHIYLLEVPRNLYFFSSSKNSSYQAVINNFFFRKLRYASWWCIIGRFEKKKNDKVNLTKLVWNVLEYRYEWNLMELKVKCENQRSY